jgi:hypothetical protein
VKIHAPPNFTINSGPERFFTSLEQIKPIHTRNFLKEAVEHALLVNLKPFVKRLPNTCLVKNPLYLKIFDCLREFLLKTITSGAVLSRSGQ